MKVILISPPVFDHTRPGLALPCLTASLREAGHTVIQKDVNVESFDLLLSRGELLRAYQIITERQKGFRFLGYHTHETDSLIEKKDFLIENVESAKRVLRDPEAFYDYKQYSESCNILENCLRFISLAYYQTELSFGSFRTAYSVSSAHQVLKSIKDENCNLYIDFYRRHTIPDIMSHMPDVAGISINAREQVIPGLTLAYMIKQANKDVHIVVGGSYFTIMEENIRKNHMLFSLFDSVILHEGETAITELVNCLEGGKSLREVPNLIYKEGSEIISNDVTHVEDIDKLPTPCFDGLPMERYFSPFPVLPIYMTRGCYWNRCTFCCLRSTAAIKHRIRSVKKVREDIQKLTQKYGQNSFTFVDEAIHPRNMEELADELLNSGVSINWATHARFEKQFDERLLKKLSASGCRYLKFGLESACERVLSLMNKGVTPDRMREVLSASSRAGIGNAISFLFGFPGETREEAGQTIKFVLDNIENINYMVVHNFVLYKNSLVYHNPQDFKIKELVYNESDDLPLVYSYRIEEGLTQQDANSLRMLFSEALRELDCIPKDSGHLLLYAVHYNSNDLQWITASSDEVLFDGSTIKKNRANKVREKAAALIPKG